MSSHGLHRRSMNFEEEAGVDCYEQMVEHPTLGIELKVSPDGQNVPLQFKSLYAEPMRAVDNRYKIALLLETFERRGGKIVYESASVEDLEELAERGPVFVAAGKGELGGLWQLDEARTHWDKPQRTLLLLLVDDLQFDPPEKYSLIEFTLSPGRGEMFYSPNLHFTNKAIHTVLMEAIPGSEADLFAEVENGEDALRVTKQMVDLFCPWENDTFENVTLPDPLAWLKGSFRPLVRHPVAHLPSGKPLFGFGDMVILNDPVAGQGGNCTAYQVHELLGGIAALEGKPVTPEWFEAGFDRFWEERGQYFTGLTNLLLTPPDEVLGSVLEAAGTHQGVADRLVDAFREPWEFLPNLESAEKAQALIAEASGQDMAANAPSR
jgi:hypothetical protein